MCEIFLKLAIKNPERCQWHHFCVFIINFRAILHIGLMFPPLSCNKYLSSGLTEVFKKYVTYLGRRWIGRNLTTNLSLNDGMERD